MRSGFKGTPKNNFAVNGLQSRWTNVKSGFAGLPEVPFDLTKCGQLRIANGVLRPDGNSSPGGTITWILLNAGGHTYDFFTSITTSSGDLVVSHPAAKIHSAVIKVDETLSGSNVWPGYNTALSTSTQLVISAYQKNSCFGGYLKGNGTNWDKFGDLPNFTEYTNTISNFTFDPVKQVSNGNQAQNLAYWNGAYGVYTGTTLDRKVVKLLSGLGSATFGYQLVVASTGSAVVSNSSADIIEIYTGTQKVIKLDHGTNDSNGWPGGNIFTTNANYWVEVLYELI